jgi:hypothetical protein
VRLPDLPHEPKHIVCQLSARFQLSPAAVLAVGGAAIGRGAVLQTALFPAPISLILHVSCAMRKLIGCSGRWKLSPSPCGTSRTKILPQCERCMCPCWQRCQSPHRGLWHVVIQ